jgi:regulator of RNase E activity RraA
MVGYAVTATFRASDSSGRGGYQVLIGQLEDVLALGVPAVVVIEDLDKPSVAATFGDMMCSSYKAFGVVGIITSGAGRDLEQVEAIGLPAFVGSVICSHGYASIEETGIPVRVGGLTIEPGELLHGDRNGVTTIPHEIASEATEACSKVVESEKRVLDYLRGESFTVQDLAAAYEECNNLQKAFGKSFSRKSD